MQIFPKKEKGCDGMNFGKNIDFSASALNETRGAGCTLLCSILCENGAISLCSCKNNKAEQKGGTYYSNRNQLVAQTREPTSV